MKLIIDIPDEIHKELFNDEEITGGVCAWLLSAVKNGTPLDDVKAEIKQKAWDTQEIDGEHENYKVVDLSDVLQILDNIDKAESEDKE